MRARAAFLFGVGMPTGFFRGSSGWRRFLRRKIGIKNVGYCFPIAVGLFFPNLDKFATIGRDGAFWVVGHQLIGADDVGQIAGTGDFYFRSLPGQRGVGAEERIPRFTNGLLVAGDRRVGRKERSIVAIVANGGVEI